MSNSKEAWLLLLACYLLWPSLLSCGTHSTPIQQTARRAREQPCAHHSIAQLIKKSPIILKALGAHIFTDDSDGYANELSALVAAALNGNGNGAAEPTNKWQSVQNNFLTSATLQLGKATATAAAAGATAASWHGSESAATLPSLALPVSTSASNRAESILITLTPETIYKGASLLKMTPGAESAARSSSAGGSGGSRSGNAGGGNSGTAAESAYQYEGQLNATLQPLSCFDGNLLKILPTELIAFGKLVTVQQQQQQQQRQPTDTQQQHQQQQAHTTTQPMDILYISINGLHRWTPQFENHIWKHLGWDDWSDFTLCSVTCGKGVQQRFRRCLLDNPMVNFNMQLNLNTVSVDDDDEDDDDVDVDVDDDNVNDEDDNVDTAEAVAAAGLRNVVGINGLVGVSVGQNAALVKENNKSQQLQQQQQHTDKTNANAAFSINLPLKANAKKTQPLRTAASSVSHHTTDSLIDSVDSVADDGEVMRTFVGNFDDELENEWTKELTNERKVAEQAKRSQRQRKRRKSTKNYSTLFCEGYNIEQRNCNTFECSDDISDLLKFYKKFPLPEDAANVALPAAMQSAPTDANTATMTMASTATATGAVGAAAVTEILTAAVDATANSSSSSSTTGATSAAAAVGSSLSSINANVAAGNMAGVGNALPSSTPANMGYIRSWRNALNFTIMLTLRVKNDSQTATTIFSIRNATHNLYLESCKDGLRLYLERDSTTEMLPVKFNLYDYRWHQVAISIQNGDFISIYVDCSWTNSFVVSKRLYSLPLDADIEIGRGFNGELQQLLVLPENQERQQCSNKRTSINEVKRYIIDTFIDDYGN